jgi:hypothetical protein
MPLKTAIAELVERCALVLSCIPGQLIYVQEDPGYLLPYEPYSFASVFMREPRS